MKKLLCVCVVVLLSVGFCAQQVDAGAWATNKGEGQILFGRTLSRSPEAGAINGALSASGFRTNGSSLDFSGAFSDFPTGTEILSGTIGLLSQPNSNIGRTISIGTAQWGSFVGTLTDEIVSGTTTATSGAAASRKFIFSGNFYVGSDNYYLGGPTGMLGSTFTLLFTRHSSGVGTTATTSARWELDTYGATAVPEPTSTAIFGAGLVGFAVRRFRKNRSCLA